MNAPTAGQSHSRVRVWGSVWYRTGRNGSDPDTEHLTLKFIQKSNGGRKTLISLSPSPQLRVRADHTQTHTHVDELKINTPAEAVCIHAIPRVCTITEEVNLIKGQRMQAGRFLAAQSDLQDGEQGDLDHCCAANIQHLIVLLSLSVVGADI